MPIQNQTRTLTPLILPAPAGRGHTTIGDVPIRLVVADDHPIVLQGLQLLFERQRDFEVVATCADAEATLDAVRTRRPDVLVLDLRLPRLSGLDVLRAIAQAGTPCRTVLLTAAITDAETFEAVRLGVAGLVLKESPPDTLLQCIRRVHEGGEWIDRDAVSRAVRGVIDREDERRGAADMLTPREIEIVRMVAQGLRNKVIGERLSISEGTVKVHLHNIYEKLAVGGRLELVLCAQQQRLV
jgi:two-component system, NarL family, nitrate/nitrite response regulator NarL